MIAQAAVQIALFCYDVVINLYGLRQPFCEPYPGPMIMDIAAREDVRIMLASDAHRTEDVAGQFDELARYARSYGYRESGIVVGGERRFLPF